MDRRVWGEGGKGTHSSAQNKWPQPPTLATPGTAFPCGPSSRGSRTARNVSRHIGQKSSKLGMSLGDGMSRLARALATIGSTLMVVLVRPGVQARNCATSKSGNKQDIKRVASHHMTFHVYCTWP